MKIPLGKSRLFFVLNLVEINNPMARNLEPQYKVRVILQRPSPELLRKSPNFIIALYFAVVNFELMLFQENTLQRQT